MTSPGSEPQEHNGTAIRTIGNRYGVRFSVMAWDSVSAEVDLAISGMFVREMPGASLTGGLAHLDSALHGDLLAIRADAIFTGQECETLLLSRPPAPIRAQAVLLIGFGEPTEWSPAVAKRVTAAAMRQALRLGIVTAAFAPGLLDSGLTGTSTAKAGAAMIEGALEALAADSSSNAESQTDERRLKHWIFDAGPAHIEDAATNFRATFDPLS